MLEPGVVVAIVVVAVVEVVVVVVTLHSCPMIMKMTVMVMTIFFTATVMDNDKY